MSGAGVKGVKEDLVKAKGLALRWLSFRPRFSREIEVYGKKHGWSSELTGKVLRYLEKEGYVNDAKLAGSLVADRKKLSRWGRSRIIRELLQKGLAADQAEVILTDRYDPEEEKQMAFELLQKKFSRTRGLQPEKLARQALAYLQRRGYNPQVIKEALRRLNDQLFDILNVDEV